MMYMEIIKNFIKEDDIISIKRTENFNGYYIKVECTSIISPEFNELSSALSRKKGNDTIRITIKSMIDEQSTVMYSEGNDIEDFIQDVEIVFDESGSYCLELDIIKDRAQSIISIYEISLFIDYLESLSLEAILNEFSKILNRYQKIKFNIIENEDINFNNSIIYFGNEVENNNCNIDRNKPIEYRTQLCNFINASKYKLSYLDFNFDFCNNLNENTMRLKQIFQKLEYVLCLISICDRSEIIEKNKVTYSLTGYKTINYDVNYNELSYTDNMSQFTEICKWLYQEDEKNLAIKIGIIRNIISISVQNDNFEDIQSDILYSIKSSHEIYLKENVEKYLQVKKEVTNSLFDLMKNISEIANNVGNKLRNNIIGIVTFFVSIIITNSLSDNKLNNIFTKDITMISISFIFISFFYMIFSIRDAYGEIDRFKVLYNRIKNNYDGILDPDDIKNIFHNDEYFDEDKKYINKKITSLIVFWILFMLIISFVIFVLGDFKFEYISQAKNNFMDIFNETFNK